MWTNFRQRAYHLFHLRGFRTVKEIKNPYNWQRYKDCWWIFLGLNVLTMVISPVSNPPGHGMTREAYMPIMWIKLSIVALLLLVGLYMKISSKLCRA